jgi:glyoxylase-like metal-dependent hydrolase (beta-lactamase superfamily II)
MSVLAGGMDYLDLNFLGRPGIIATAVLKSAGGVALVDPGPSTTLDGLLKSLGAQGITVRDVRQILLTHIHLDHAGATGSLLRMNPGIDVFVHERGARHLIDPSKLVASATRLYGDDMDRLWGAVLPVPAARVTALYGDERLSAGGRELEVAHTPGHASHHVTFFDRSSGVAFVGDTAGIRRGDGSYIMPPTPPPDIDLEAWRVSADRILAWQPDTLRTVSRRADALPGALRAPRHVERDCAPAFGGCLDRRPGAGTPFRRGRPSGPSKDCRRKGS